VRENKDTKIKGDTEGEKRKLKEKKNITSKYRARNEGK
jgi:hypothetical protein